MARRASPDGEEQPRKDGAVTRRVRALVKALRESGEGLDEAGEARAALAVLLAQLLDGGATGMSAAGLSRELSACLDRLAPEVTDDGAKEEFEGFLAGLSRPG